MTVSGCEGGVQSSCFSSTVTQVHPAAPVELLETRRRNIVCCCGCLCYAVTSRWPVQLQTCGRSLLPGLFSLCCVGTLCCGGRGQKGQWDWCCHWSCCTRGSCRSGERGQGDSSQIKDWLQLNGLKGTWPHGGIRKVWPLTTYQIRHATA